MRRHQSGTRWISVAEAARIIGVIPGYVRMLVDSRRLRAKRGAVRVRLVDRASAQRFARARARRRAQKNFRQPFRPRAQEETAPPAPASS